MLFNKNKKGAVMIPSFNSGKFDKYIPDLKKLAEGTGEIINNNISHVANTLKKEGTPAQKLAEEVSDIIDLNPEKVKQAAQNVGEPLTNISKNIMQAVRESDNPAAKSFAAILDKHNLNPEEILENHLKNKVNNGIDDLFQKGNELSDEIAKEVIKTKVKNKLFKNKFMQAIYEYFIKIKEALFPKKISNK